MSDVYGPGLWGEAPLASSEEELEARRFERPASGAARLRAVAGQSAFFSLDMIGEGWRGLENASNVFADQVVGGDVMRSEGFYVPHVYTAERANELYGIEGALNFDGPVTAPWAAHRYERTRRDLARADIIERAREGNALTDFGVSLAVGLVDPVNFIFPFGRVSALRAAAPGLAAWEAGEALAPRMLARGVFGAAEGALFAGALEPGFYGLAQLGEIDYGLEQSLVNMIVGAGFNGVLNAGGAVFERPSAAAREEARRMPPEAAAASEETRAAAALHAVQAASEGRPVEAAAVYAATADARAAELARFAADAGTIPHRPVSESEVFAPSGMRERATYAIVEIEDAIASHTDDLTVDPRYPAALQPRDRTRATSEAQLAAIAADFEPQRLEETFQGDAGAPVLGSDGAVESGNARTIVLRRLYRAGDPRADAYRAWLVAQGYPVEGFRAPFLVRLTDARRDPAARVRFAEELNKPASASMSATEAAFADARRLDAGVLDAADGDPAAFARTAIGRLTSEAERGALIDAQGRLSQAGERRLEAALMARAYNDPASIEMRFESVDDELKTVGGALSDAAPAMARLAARIDSGEVGAEFDLRASLGAATAVLRAARRAGKSVKTFLRELAEQGDMFDAGLHPRTLDMLQLLVDNGTRVRARAKISAMLDVYAKAAEASPAPVMFDEARIDYESAFEAAGRAAGEPGLRARDVGGAEGGGRGPDQGGEGAGSRIRDSRDAVAADFERQLSPRFGDDAEGMARVIANGYANLGAYYGETAQAVVDATGSRIEDAAAGSSPGRRLAQPARRALKREQRAADKGVQAAERQAVAFLAAAECIAREGLSDAGGRGASELLAGLGAGLTAAVPAGIVAANAAQDNVSPEAGSAEWTRRARVLGERAMAELDAIPPTQSGDAGPVETWRSVDLGGVPAPGSSPGEDTGPPRGFAVPGDEKIAAAEARARAGEGASLIDAFAPLVEYTLEEREDLEAEALMEAFEPLIEEGRRRERRRARRVEKADRRSKEPLVDGQIEPGNIDLSTRPIVRNADGSISTVRSMSFEDDGREVLVPTVSDDGRIMSDDEAIAEYRRTGRHLGIFEDAETATAFARRLHDEEEQRHGGER